MDEERKCAAAEARYRDLTETPVPKLILRLSVPTNMMLQSISKGVKATIAASARSGLFFIPLILTLPRLFGLAGVEMTQAIADVCAACLSIPLAVSELRKMKDPDGAYDQSGGEET